MLLDSDVPLQIYPGGYPGLTLGEVRARLGGSDDGFNRPATEDSPQVKTPFVVTFFALGDLFVVSRTDKVYAVIGACLAEGGHKSLGRNQSKWDAQEL